jgi:hypothetical protein
VPFGVVTVEANVAAVIVAIRTAVRTAVERMEFRFSMLVEFLGYRF